VRHLAAVQPAGLPLTEAPAAYAKFDKRIDGYTKVLLHPAA
jgi:glutathione-independent formaldehyde dehydrogenase